MSPVWIVLLSLSIWNQISNGNRYLALVSPTKKKEALYIILNDIILLIYVYTKVHELYDTVDFWTNSISCFNCLIFSESHYISNQIDLYWQIFLNKYELSHFQLKICRRWIKSAPALKSLYAFLIAFCGQYEGRLLIKSAEMLVRCIRGLF